MSLAATNAVWRDSRQRGTARLVLLAIADRADDHGIAWPSIRDLAERTLVTVRHVKRIVSALERDGELRVTAGGGRANTNRYELTALNGDDSVTPERVTPVSETVTSVPERVTLRAEKGDTHVTRTTKERKSNTALVVQPSTFPTTALAVPTSPEIESVYDHWRTCRHKTRASYERISPKRRQKIQARLSDGFTADELKLAISNVDNEGWDGRDRFDDITYLLRSREQVDRFLEMDAPRNGNGHHRGLTPEQIMLQAHSFAREAP